MTLFLVLNGIKEKLLKMKFIVVVLVISFQLIGTLAIANLFDESRKIRIADFSSVKTEKNENRKCFESLRPYETVYKSIKNIQILEKTKTEPELIKKQYEVELWRDLASLYHFLKPYKVNEESYDFLLLKDFDHLKELLTINQRIPSKIAIHLKTMETMGLTPKRPDIIIRAVLKLNTIMKGNHEKLCLIYSCQHAVRIDHQCVFANCAPRLTSENIFGMDGSVKTISYFEYSVKMKIWNYNVVLWEKRELEIDEGTQAIRAQNAAGKAYIDSLIHSANLKSESGKPWVFFFFDLNNLGVVNYFMDGQKSGDNYIAAFANALKSKFNETDHFFRIGGDEFILISENRDLESIERFVESLVDQFYYDGSANYLLTQQWDFNAVGINVIEYAQDLETLKRSPASHLLKSHWIHEAEEDFDLFKANFKHIYKEELLRNLRWQRFLMKPTFSVGVKAIGPADTLESLTALSSCQSGECKKAYKEAQGANAVKLGGEVTNEQIIEDNIKHLRVIKPKMIKDF